MNETYSHQFNSWQRFLQKTLGMWRINKDSVDFTWGYFSPRWGLSFVLNRGGYFDSSYSITFCFIWGLFNIKLPFHTKLSIGCDLPKYGFEFYEDLFWIHRGGEYESSMGQMKDRKTLTFYLPFKHWVFDGHWVLDKNNNWIKMGNKLNELPKSWEFKESPECLVEVYDYTYTLKKGEVQHRKATCTVEKRKWHRKWFPWITMERKVIDVEFDGEVGERTGSWKGGTIGCGYDLLEGETIEQCLRRMERDRKFK